MKFFAAIALFSLVVTGAFADHHEEGKKKMGHDKEHSHVDGAKIDHGHDEVHHKPHDHKAHHPEHKDEKVKTKKTKTKKNK